MSYHSDFAIRDAGTSTSGGEMMVKQKLRKGSDNRDSG